MERIFHFLTLITAKSYGSSGKNIFFKFISPTFANKLQSLSRENSCSPHNLLAGIRSRLLSGIHVHRSKRSCKNKKYLFVYVCFECKQNKKKVIFASRSGLHRTNLNEMFLEFFFCLLFSGYFLKKILCSQIRENLCAWQFKEWFCSLPSLPRNVRSEPLSVLY